MEDMKESDSATPIVLEKAAGKLIIRTNDNALKKDFDLSAVKQFHCFPSDPQYGVLEICYDDGPARLEVLRAPNREVIEQVHNFIFMKDFAYPPPPVLSKVETPSLPDSYERPESGQHFTNGVSTLEFHTEEGYEEVALKLVDETLNQSVSPVLIPEGDQVKRTRSTSSTSSVSSDSQRGEENNDEVSTEQSDREPAVEPQVTKEPETKHFTRPSSERRFGKLRLLSDLIEEECLCQKHNHDDGRLYIVSKKPSDASKIRPLYNGVTILEGHSYPKKYVYNIYH
ncbi:unnamed protein product [Mesocestoides corti]|uniref:Uncharacterized protein n=1 Tax=Mesocestoides corti TaxID=53468 RepID=A0A0R3UNE3_MESCO|nr:unnamed protein product [Mesocestoides corti]